MLSIEESVFLLAAGMVLIGRKGVPHAAHSLGLALGRAAQILRRARGTYGEFAKKNELHELHRELQSGMNQLNEMRSEWASLTRPASIFAPTFDDTLMDPTKQANRPVTNNASNQARDSNQPQNYKFDYTTHNPAQVTQPENSHRTARASGPSASSSAASSATDLLAHSAMHRRFEIALKAKNKQA